MSAENMFLLVAPFIKRTDASICWTELIRFGSEDLEEDGRQLCTPTLPKPWIPRPPATVVAAAASTAATTTNRCHPSSRRPRPPPQIVMPFGDCPVRSTCPACSQSVVTNVDHEIGSHAICMCVLLFCVGCDMGCCFIPFCMDSCKDVVHTCPACGIQIAKYDR
ncbi:hypothetical protein LSAT2_012300 [Lamellibrachia satsuma]|nr:hypothetical protein LSAT2_012300 [Lamellibrachia satsuma]